MGSLRRWLVWGLVLAPVVILPGSFVFARIWLNHHLKRELAFGEIRIRIAKPVLGWNLDFTSDSLEILSPAFNLSTGRMVAELRLWHSLVSMRPALGLGVEAIRVVLPKDSASPEEKIRRKAHRKAPKFPNVRIPIPFNIAVSRIEVFQEERLLTRFNGVRLYSQGPKGAGVEADSLTVLPVADSSADSSTDAPITAVTLAGSYRASARWFGRSVNYQFRFENAVGDHIRLEGGHRKSDLRLGNDSLDLGIGNLSAYALLFPGKRLLPVRDLRLEASDSTDTHLVLRTHIRVTTPPFFKFGAQHLEGTGNFQDSSGRLVLASKGDSGESLYLQGQFHLPSPTHAAIPELLSGLSASFSGYSHNLHMGLGGKVLPAVVDIRRLTIHPGLTADADVSTKDSSALHLRAFRDSTWRLAFAGKISPSETWAHGWTDTNIAYRDARVSGEVHKGGVEVEAWTRNARAYGAVADSLYAKQVITKTGYYLTQSKLYWNDVEWPVTGQVEWGKRAPGVGRHRPVSLEFQTKHPRYGSVSFAMPRRKYMEVRADEVVLERLPYPRLVKLFALQPVVSGSFDWDWLARAGGTDIHSSLSYGGERLGLDAKGSWDANRLSLATAEASFAGSKIRVSGDLRLGGKQFYQLKHLDIKDVQGVALEAERFDAARLSVFLGAASPVDHGMLNGRLAYTDTTGFHGTYEVDSLDLKPLRKQLGITRLTLQGQGESLVLSMRTAAAPGYPWFNDSVSLKIGGVLGRAPELSLLAVSDDGLTISFLGRSQDFHDLDGAFSLGGRAVLPGQGGEVRDLHLSGHVSIPFSNDLVSRMTVDSGTFGGRYAVPGLDTQTFQGSIAIHGGHLSMPDLKARNSGGPTLTGEADCDFTGPPKVTAKLHGENLALQWPGIQKLVLRDAEASLRIDTAGLFAEAKVGAAAFRSSRAPVNIQGDLENLALSYRLPPAPRKGVAAQGIPELKIKAGLRNFLFQHKLGFREVQKFFRTVKVDKKKKRIKPMDVQISLETAGPSNRIETDILRMYFTGDLNVRGIYPYTLLTGEFSSLSGEVGQSSQSYDITDFDLKWQNATLEEGRVTVEGGKKLKYDCKPDTKRTCNVYIKLDGRLDEMAFTYDSDCGTNSGEAIEPSALINSVSRGCYSDQYVAGAGGGNYGEAVVNFLEPTINEKLSSVGNRFSLGWIKSTQVSGIGTVVSSDTVGSEPIAIGLESKEKWGMSLKAKAGYYPEKKVQNPWENKVALQWRPPLEKVATNSKWKRRVRDRVTLEASAETRQEDRVGETDNKQQVRKQVGVSYHYKFWDLW